VSGVYSFSLEWSLQFLKISKAGAIQGAIELEKYIIGFEFGAKLSYGSLCPADENHNRLSEYII